MPSPDRTMTLIQGLPAADVRSPASLMTVPSRAPRYSWRVLLFIRRAIPPGKGHDTGTAQPSKRDTTPMISDTWPSCSRMRSSRSTSRTGTPFTRGAFTGCLRPRSSWRQITRANRQRRASLGSQRVSKDKRTRRAREENGANDP
jgi:hypothetical protein